MKYKARMDKFVTIKIFFQLNEKCESIKNDE